MAKTPADKTARPRRKGQTASRPVAADITAPSQARVADARLDGGRPQIWVDGTQAPAFRADTFAQAGMLLAREAADAGLLFLSSEASALAARLELRDWSGFARKLGRAAPYWPTAPGTSRLLDGLAQHAEAGRRILYDLPTPKTKPEPAAEGPTLTWPSPRVVTPQRPQRQRAQAESLPAAEPVAAPADEPIASIVSADDPDLAAIRALMQQEPPPAPASYAAPRRIIPAAIVSDSAAPSTAPAPVSRAKAPRRLPAPVKLGADWAFVRALTGTFLLFATPVGYVRALMRHLNGVDLREIVADCLQTRAN